jgi:hypothetical protein
MISHKLSKGMYYSALLPCGLQVLYWFQRIATQENLQLKQRLKATSRPSLHLFGAVLEMPF